MKKATHVVIIGAGFGGIQCGLRLGKLIKKYALTNIRITLIDKNRYHTFIPALYEVASASTKVSEDALYHRANVLIKHILLGTTVGFIKAQVNSINFKDNYIGFDDGNGIDFNYLVLACGTKSNFYNIAGLQEHSLDLKDFISALRIRRAIKLGDQVPRHILIGGGGITGVELAGELHACLRNEQIQISIVEGSERILPSFPEKVACIASARLKKLNIHLKTGSFVKEVTSNEVILANGEHITYDSLFWTGGIAPQALIEGLSLQKEKGFLKVAPCLEVINEEGVIQEQIFALGDSCITYDAQGKLIPWTAQKAIAEGQYVAQAIFASLTKQDKGICQPQKVQFVIPIGGKWAIAYVYGILYKGMGGWILKNLIEFKYLLSILPWYRALARWTATIITFSRND